MVTGIDIKGYSYLGASVQSPLNVVDGSARLVIGVDAVIQSIVFALNTPLGSLFFRPEYGSKLHLLLFQPNDNIIADLGKTYIQQAINNNESRVEFVNSSFVRNNDEANFVITYRILASNELGILRYPFYKK